jgi:preprotein translocase subunit YajC
MEEIIGGILGIVIMIVAAVYCFVNNQITAGLVVLDLLLIIIGVAYILSIKEEKKKKKDKL